MHKLNIYSVTRVLFILPRYGTNALSKFNPDTELVLYPLQDKLTSRDKILDLSAFKLCRLFFSLLSSGLRLSILKVTHSYLLIVLLNQLVKSRDEISIRRGYCDNRDLSRLKWFTYVHDVILEVNDYLILCAYEFGVKYGTNALSKFSPDTELVLYPLQDKLTSGDKSLDLSAFKLSRLFFSLLSSGSSSCWRSYGAQ
ncbi:hypothetical protein Tco_0510908 [Tanacetum coccineum]